MGSVSEGKASGIGTGELQPRILNLLGGERIFGQSLKNQLDVHEMLLEGLPGKALNHLVDNLVILRMPVVP